MGRWDALRPEVHGAGTRLDLGTASRRHHKNNVRSSASTIAPANRGTFGGTAICTGDGTGRGILSRYEELRRLILDQKGWDTWRNVDMESVVIIACLISAQNDLPAEKVAHEAVYEIILPVMMSGRCDSESYCSLCSSLCSMLRNSRLSSAMLAPSVSDVDWDGAVTLAENPIRRLLFKSFLEKIQSPCHAAPCAVSLTADASSLRWSCRTLSTALTEACKVDGTKRQLNDEMDALASTIRSFLSSVLSRNRHYRTDEWNELLDSALMLLESFLSRYPESSSVFASLIWESSSNIPTDICCGGNDASSFLNLLHQENQRAVLCMVVMINNFPLSSWMQDEKPLSPLHSTLTFPGRMNGGLESTMRIASCLISRHRGNNGETLLSLSSALLLRIPFDRAPSLKSSAMDLMNCVACSLESTFKDPASSRKEIDAFLHLAGGRIMPDGSTAAMCVPLRLWLETQRGRSFIQALLERLRQPGRPQQHDRLLEQIHCIMRSILFSHPRVVIDDSTLWNEMWLSFDFLTSDVDGDDRKDGIRLFESFLRGRSHFAIDNGDHSRKVERFLVRLRLLLVGCHSSCKTIVCTTLAYLLPADWDTLGIDNCVSLIETVARLGPELGGNICADVFKAIGNICSTYYDPSRLESLSKNEDREAALCHELISVTLQGCVDQNAKARCMAIFALGNLCLAMCQNVAVSFLVKDSTLASVTSNIRQCLGDSDDKVKGNAIRSMAHILCLAHLKSDDGVRLQPLEQIRDALSSLARQALNTLSLLDKDAVRGLTWKERQSLKKLGWGSFNALARIFETGVAFRDELSEKIESVLQVLVECVSSSLWTQSDKAFAAACSCLRAAISEGSPVVSRGVLHEGNRSGGGGVVARCAWSCISILLPDIPGPTHGNESSGRARSKTKLYHEVEALLKILLENSSVHDAKLVLNLLPRSNFAQYLRWLYEWMDIQASSPIAFRSVASALTNTLETQSIDPELEMRFVVRAATLPNEQEDVEEEEM